MLSEKNISDEMKTAGPTERDCVIVDNKNKAFSKIDSLRILMLLAVFLALFLFFQIGIRYYNGKQAELQFDLDAPSVTTLQTETELITEIGMININTATVDELCLLDGIGEKKAQAIVDYRTENGFFSTTEEIMNVSGIGETIFDKIKDRISVTDE